MVECSIDREELLDVLLTQVIVPAAPEQGLAGDMDAMRHCSDGEVGAACRSLYTLLEQMMLTIFWQRGVTAAAYLIQYPQRPCAGGGGGSKCEPPSLRRCVHTPSMPPTCIDGLAAVTLAESPRHFDWSPGTAGRPQLSHRSGIRRGSQDVREATAHFACERPVGICSSQVSRCPELCGLRAGLMRMYQTSAPIS